MKKEKIIIMLLAATSMLNVVGCNEFQPVDKRLYSDKPELFFVSEASSETIEIVSGEDWNAETADSWISVSPSSGKAGKSHILINVEKHDSDIKRTGDIDIFTESRKISVSVIQMPNAKIVLDRDSIGFPAEGGIEILKISSENPFEILISDEDSEWLGISTDTKSISKEVSITAEKNPTYKKRQTEIIVRTINGKYEEKIKITQHKKFSELIDKWGDFNLADGNDPRGTLFYFRDLINPQDNYITCPEGYKIPDVEDFKDLIANYAFRWDDTPDDNLPYYGLNGIWFGVTQDDVDNAKYGDSHGCIFFPARGRSLDLGGMINALNTEGFYFSDTHTESNGLYMLHLSEEGPKTIEFNEREANLTWACTVRCIKEK